MKTEIIRLVFSGESRGGTREPAHNSSVGFEGIDTKQTRWFPSESEEGSISVELHADKCWSPGTTNRDVTAPEGNRRLPCFHVTEHKAENSKGRRNLEMLKSFYMINMTRASLNRQQSHVLLVSCSTHLLCVNSINIVSWIRFCF